jgi:hypothetical protein
VIDASGVAMRLSAHTNDAEPTPGAARFDNFNLLP